MDAHELNAELISELEKIRKQMTPEKAMAIVTSALDKQIQQRKAAKDNGGPLLSFASEAVMMW
jgi:hypothetical protein